MACMAGLTLGLLICFSLRLQVLGNKGREFIFGLMENLCDQFGAYMVITSDQPANVTVIAPSIQLNLSYQTTDGFLTVNLSEALHHDIVGKKDKGIFARADVDISIYLMSDCFNTPESFLVLPVSNLGTRYLVGMFPSGDHLTEYSEIFIVARNNNTNINITLRARGPVYLDGIKHEYGDVYSFSTSGYETFLLQSGYDLTGTEIRSDKPVAVTSGNLCNYGKYGSSGNCEHIFEQMPPVNSWGTDFIALPFNTSEITHVKAVSLCNGTEVYVHGKGMSILEEGRYAEYEVSGPTFIRASRPILLLEMAEKKVVTINGIRNGPDPFMTVVPPFSQFLTDYTFSLPFSDLQKNNFTENFVVVTIDSEHKSGILLDGVIATAIRDYVVLAPEMSKNVTILVYQMNSPGRHRLQHISADVMFGAVLYGAGICISYGHPLGIDINESGNFTLWTEWGPCSASCGGGVKMRTRTCAVISNPDGSSLCNGDTKETWPCNIKRCTVSANFTEWTEWEPCSESCGGGIKTRTRACSVSSNPDGSSPCTGDTNETQTCNVNSCLDAESMSMRSSRPYNVTGSDNKESSDTIIAIVVSVIIGIVAVVVIAVFVFYRRRKHRIKTHEDIQLPVNENRNTCSREEEEVPHYVELRDAVEKCEQAYIPDEGIPRADFRKVYSDLQSIDAKTGKSNFLIEFELFLEKTLTTYGYETLTKNRDGYNNPEACPTYDDLAGSGYELPFTIDLRQITTYLPIDNRTRFCIVTNLPLTSLEFWATVFDNVVGSILFIGEKNMELDKGMNTRLKPFHIEGVGEKVHGGVNITSLVISSTEHRRMERKVKHAVFQSIDLAAQLPHDLQEVATIYLKTVKPINKGDNPNVLIHINGTKVEQSEAICCAFAVLQHLDETDMFDLRRALDPLKKIKQDIVNNFELFKYLYDVVYQYPRTV